MAQISLKNYIADDFVTDDVVSDLLKKFSDVKGLDPSGVSPEKCSTVNGWHSSYNLLDHNGFQEIAENIVSLFPNGNEIFKCSFLQFVEYYDGGWCKEHDHSRTEDYSFIVYLNTTTSGGKTIFFADGVVVAHRPIKGKVVFFPSRFKHLAEPNVGNKIVFVGALQLK
jgi:hypothetical protein